MKITCIADLHGHYPKLPGGDLLIIAGDFTARDDEIGWVDFETWILNQNYKNKIMVAGNHDNFLASLDEHRMWKYWDVIPNVTYLCDSGTEIEGLKIWGSPWTKTFPGMNPHCKAFTVDTEEELAKKWALIPNDVDILVTHSPPYSIGDEITSGPYPMNVGSRSLCERLLPLNHKLHIFGHVHEGYCHEQLNRNRDDSLIHVVNASHVDEHYKPINRPFTIEL